MQTTGLAEVITVLDLREMRWSTPGAVSELAFLRPVDLTATTDDLAAARAELGTARRLLGDSGN